MRSTPSHLPACRTRLVPMAIIAFGVSGCLGDPADPKVDSESHFLSGCLGDSDCGGDYSCVCNLCTVPCGAVGSCTEVAPNATCVATTSSGTCFDAAVVADYCGFGCSAEVSCPTGLDCYLGVCRRDVACPDGSSWDGAVGYCVTPWTNIPRFGGTQQCGPDYYFIELPFGMNEFRPRQESSVTGGVLTAVIDLVQPNLWSFSPNGESNVCGNLWGDDMGTWIDGTRRVAGLTTEECGAPVTPPPIASLLRGCGVYAFGCSSSQITAAHA